MAEVGTAFVSIVPSARGFGAALNAQTGPAAIAAGKDGGKKFGGGFIGASKSALKGFAGIFAAGLVVKGLKDVVAEAREAQKVGAITAQVIKTTGGVANVSAGQVGKLATAISNKTGVDDEAIQKGSNLLLTFKNVRNEVGKGNQVFNQATKAAVDLSAAGFGSIDSASKMLGKALNDPIKGMTALGRAGVTFSESQKNTIKALVESGDVLGAQKIILKEVQSQVGGTAAASATAGEKMRTAWNNAKESLGTALLPAIDKLQIAITTKIIPAIVSFIGFLQKNPAIVKAFGIAIAAVAAAFVIAFVAANALVIGIGLLVAGLVYAYTQSETFRAIVNAVFKAVRAVVVTTIKVIVAVVRAGVATIKAIWNGITTIVTVVRTAIGKVLKFFRDLPGNIVQAIKSLTSKLKNAGEAAMTGLWNGLKTGAKKVYDKAREIVSKVGAIFKNALKLGSPSRLFRDFGQWTVQGYVQGIDKERRTVTPAMQRLANTATLPTSGLTSPRIGAIAPAAASGPLDGPLYLTVTNWETGAVVIDKRADKRISVSNQQGAINARFA